MNKFAIAAILVLIAGILFAIVAGASLISTNNTAVRMENGLTAADDARFAVLATHANKIAELVQVPAMYRDDFKNVLVDTMKGRYGQNGSQAAFQWLKENQINYDSSLYVKIQEEIVAGRDAFLVAQNILIDKVQVYNNYRGQFPNSFVLSFFGFPKVNMDKFKPVLADYAAGARATGIENGLKLR